MEEYWLNDQGNVTSPSDRCACICFAVILHEKKIGIVMRYCD